MIIAIVVALAILLVLNLSILISLKTVHTALSYIIDTVNDTETMASGLQNNLRRIETELENTPNSRR